MYRTRTQDGLSSTIGSYTVMPGGAIVYSPAQTRGTYRRTYDQDDGKSTFNNFDTYLQTKEGGEITGYRTAGDLVTPDRIYSAYPCTKLSFALQDPDGSNGFPVNVGQQLAWAWKILAETNPGQSEVLTPQYLKEFAEIPSLLRWRGLSMLNRIGKIALLDKWALRPLLSDLSTMYSLNNAIHNRMLELNKLAEGKMLTRRVKLGQGQKIKDVASSSMESAAASISGSEHHTYSYRAWGSVQWFAPSWSPYRSMPPPLLQREAVKDALALSTHGALATLWEIIPWSWLADWCGNIGDIINSAHNSFWLTYRGMCLMLHQKSTFTHTPLPLSGRSAHIEVTPIVTTWEKKRRWANLAPILPVPTFGMPILTSGRLSTVAYLLAANAKR